jgi:hypothetical protein
MNFCLHSVRMSALAYLYDNAKDLPNWMSRLTRDQREDIANIMTKWDSDRHGPGIVPMEEIEKREVLRAVAVCDGNLLRAARMLRMGKTTIYRKMVRWGYSVQNRILIEQASVLADAGRKSPRVSLDQISDDISLSPSDIGTSV